MSDIQLDSKFLRKLEHLMLQSLGVYSGEMMGGRRSKRRGNGIEFTDHKSYSPGDDLRYLDWNVLGRLDELFLKIYEMEEDLYVYILVDSSKSMSFGNPTKMATARMVAACLGYIGLAKQDIVRLTFFGDGLASTSDIFKGRGRIFRVFDFLNAGHASGATNFAESLHAFVRYNRRHGIAIVISDFLDPAGIEPGLKTLIHNRFAIYGLHVVDPLEEKPALVGDLNLVDSETDAVLPVSIRRQTIEAYGEFFERHCLGIRRFLNSYAGHYIKVPTTTTLEDLILKVFRREGILR